MIKTWFFTAAIMLTVSANAAPALRCDQDSIVSSVEKSAGKYVRSHTDYLFDHVRMTEEAWKTANGIFEPEPWFRLSAFRDRGPFGKGGLSCAALVKAYLKTPATLDLMVDYTIEPATDGEIVVTTKFQPNP